MINTLNKIVIAPDSFKGTMSSIEVCNIIEKAIKNILPETVVVKIPIADGGEGTVDSYLSGVLGSKETVTIKDPLFRDIEAFYGILEDKKTAVIEIAAASGLPLVGNERNPEKTTTYGTGQLIVDAIEKGCTKIIIGLGGSATNDGGIGMMAALGAKFLDKQGREIPLTGGGLAQLDRIDVAGVDKRLKQCEILVACDVNNPLCGKEGAAYVFSPQKGADARMVEALDKNLEHYASIIYRDLGIDVQKIPGAGAAGGLGAGLVAFTGANLKSGINLILDCVNFENVINDANLIITGEGKIDGQSLRGKVPVGIAERASKMKVPVIVIAGDIGDDLEELYKIGINAIFSTNRKSVPFEVAKETCRDDLLKTAESIIRFAELLINQSRK